MSSSKATQPFDEATERSLVLGLRAGDVGSFDRVYAAYGPRVFSFLLRLAAGRWDTAEDLAQETWIKLANAAPSIRDDSRIGPLVFTIARNAYVSHRRWAMLDVSRFVMMGFDTISSLATARDDSTPETSHEQATNLANLEAALASLPLASREVLLLVGVEGIGQDDVARMLGLTYEALRQRLRRARAQLAGAMAKLEAKRPRRDSREKDLTRKEPA